jgi:hypothetical protein
VRGDQRKWRTMVNADCAATVNGSEVFARQKSFGPDHFSDRLRFQRLFRFALSALTASPSAFARQRMGFDSSVT